MKTQPLVGQVLAPNFQNGFIGAIYKAYNEHRHLILRPDDVWLAITTALGLYVNNHAEEMRHTFVEHEGKKEIKVYATGSLYSANWSSIIDQFAAEIEKNTKDDMRAWIEPSFSTTTHVTKTVGQVVLMGVMKKYFDYKLMLLCGLPEVTLEGTVDDWKDLRVKASRLKDLGVECLAHWAGLLDFVLSHFVNAFSGNADKDFWNRVCHRSGGGSGPSYLGGWVNVFIPFGKDNGEYKLMEADPDGNKWGRVDMDSIPGSTTEVPVLIDDNGTTYSTIFYGGHIVCVYDESKDTIRPSLDWAMVDITEFLDSEGSRECSEELGRLHARMNRMRAEQQNYNWQDFPKPVEFTSGG